MRRRRARPTSRPIPATVPRAESARLLLDWSRTVEKHGLSFREWLKREREARCVT